ncbi:MAG: carbon storage regulator [Planctomycetota bacterium]
MLVLSRKIGERIVLPGNGVEIAVLAIRGKRVRIGIEAPRGAAVHRAEIWQRILDAAKPIPGGAPMDESICECSSP